MDDTEVNALIEVMIEAYGAEFMAELERLRQAMQLTKEPEDTAL